MDIQPYLDKTEAIYLSEFLKNFLNNCDNANNFQTKFWGKPTKLVVEENPFCTFLSYPKNVLRFRLLLLGTLLLQSLKKLRVPSNFSGKKSTFLKEYRSGFQQADVFSEWLPELIYYVVTHCVHPSKIWHCKEIRKAGWKNKNTL